MQSVFCIATSERLADRMLERLKEAEVPAQEVSVLVPASRDLHGGRLTAWWTEVDDLGEEVIEDTLAWLSTVREVSVREVGPMLTVGPVLAVLEEVGPETGLVAALQRLGLAEFEARRYAAELRAGRILLAVHTRQRDQAQRSEQVFEECAGEDIATAISARAA